MVLFFIKKWVTSHCKILRMVSGLRKMIIALGILCLSGGYVFASHPQEKIHADSIKNNNIYADSIGLLRGTPSWMRSYLNSLIRGNVDRSREKKFDVSFGISPSYTREASFGIGAMMSGLYRLDRNDTIVGPSDVFASFNASLNGFYVLTLKGNNLFTDNRSRLNYKIEIYKKRLDFWGINSEETANNPKSAYDRRQIDFDIKYVYRLTHSLFIGANIKSDYTDARKLTRPEFLLGERKQYYVTGLGASIEIDSRDNLVTPTKGFYVCYRPMFFPKFLGNAPSFFNSHEVVADAYLRAWKGAIVAFDFRGKFNSSKAPWTMREMIASDGIRMRGYYMGSYMDNSQITIQTELRQHVYRRLGIALWIGEAALFSSLKDFKHKEIKPEWVYNCGVGLRFEFKHNVNARIDYGFGKHTSGLVFAIGEAF